MDEPHAAPREPAPDLRAAVRKARVEQAERSEVVAELRGAEIARLEMLFEALKPILAQVPKDIDIFDAGIVPGERARLFVDMIAFVEMGHDRRQYRFIQEARHGRMVIAESARIDAMVEALTDYIARRLVERQLALSGDTFIPLPESAYRAGEKPPVRTERPPARAPEAAPPPRRRWFATALLFTVELLGSIVLFVLLAGAAFFAWRFGEAWWVAHFAQLN
ncbi:MAG: hypothetical protein JWN93_3532 [Hyphomicrobiales bacterium]|nr:hypothetical protein [Hyphomicrobiales bacterium]